MKYAVAAVALLFVCALLFATVYVLIDNGPDVLTAIGVVVVAVLAFGIFGALTEQPQRRRR